MFSVCSVLLVWAVPGGLVSAQEYLALKCCQQSAAPGLVVLVTAGLFVLQGEGEIPYCLLCVFMG